VRLDVVQRDALRLEETLERADLVNQAIGQFFPTDFHFAPAESLQIGQRGMGADRNAVLFRQPDRRAHMIEIRGVEAARHVGNIDHRHQGGVVAHAVETERLAHIAIDRGHSLSYAPFGV